MEVGEVFPFIWDHYHVLAFPSAWKVVKPEHVVKDVGEYPTASLGSLLMCL